MSEYTTTLLAQLASRGSPVRLLVTGGGSGGHTFPAIAVTRRAQELLASKGIKCDVLYVGSEKGLEHRVADKEGIPFEAIQVGKLRRDRNALRLLSAANLRDALKVPQGIAQAVGIVVRFNPDV